MATLKYIRGLSGRGFRVKDNTGAWKTCKEKVEVQVDIDDPGTQQILSRERDNFIRISGTGVTTAQIIPLAIRGFRIQPFGGTFTVTIASPGVFTLNSHGYVAGDALVFSTTGALPTGLTPGTAYYVISAGLTTNSFQVATAPGGSAINTTGSQSGTHTVTPDPKQCRVGPPLTAPLTVDLNDGRTLRQLKRARREWAASASGTSLAIRGLVEQQNSVALKNGANATAVLSSNGTVPADNDTVVVNNVTYRFKTTIAQANDVARGASSDAALDALVKAVNQTGLSGTDYFAGTVAPTGVTAAARTGTGATGKVTFTATDVGTTPNAFPSTTPVGVTLSFSGATFGTGSGTTAGKTVDKIRKLSTITVDPSKQENYRTLRRHYRSWIEA